MDVIYSKRRTDSRYAKDSTQIYPRYRRKYRRHLAKDVISEVAIRKAIILFFKELGE